MRNLVKKASALILAYILAFIGIPFCNTYASEDPVKDINATASPAESGYVEDFFSMENCTGNAVSPMESREEADTFAEDGVQTFSIEFTYGQSRAREMLPLINELRSGRNAWAYAQDGSVVNYLNLPKLSYDYALEKIAMQRAAEIAVLYSSERPDGSSYSGCMFDGVTSAGENIVYVKNGALTEAEAMEYFKETAASYSGQTRRRRMLNSTYTAVGVGFATYGGYSLWVQEFGTGVSLSPYVNAEDSEQQVEVAIKTSRITDIGDFEPDRRYITLVLGSPADQSMSEEKLPQITRTLTVTGSPDGMELRTAPSDITWTTDDQSVVRVIGDRLLAAGPGRGVVSGTGADWSGNLTVTVVVPATGVKFNTVEIELSPGDTYQTAYDIMPANAYGYVVSYKSEDPSVAVIDQNGLITAAKRGETAVEISVTTRELDFVRTALCYVVVRGDVPQPVDPEEENPTVLTAKQLIAKQKITIYSTVKVTKWKTSDKKIAKVKGLKKRGGKWRAKVTAKARGDVEIYGYRGKRMVFKCRIQVEKPAFDKTNVVTYDSFYMISRISMVETANPSKYETTKPEILSINETTGKIGVKKNGTVNIYVYYGKARYKVKLKVRLPRIKYDTVTVKRWKTKLIKIKYKRTDTVYEWLSDRPDIAWVDKTGRVHAIRKGKARISLMVNGLVYDTCLVKVKKK